MINATIEVRMTSSRLPGKVMLPASGLSMLEILIKRISCSKYIDNIIVATTVNQQDDPIIRYCQTNEIKYFRGSEENVLERVYNAGKLFGTDTLVQITGDCPLIDFKLVDEMIEIFQRNYPKTRFVSNTGPEISMPWGFDVNVFKLHELSEILADSPTEEDKEHVSFRFYDQRNNFKYSPIFHKYHGARKRPELRVTLDYLEDYELIKAIIEDFGIDELCTFGIDEIISWLDEHPTIRDKAIKRHSDGR
jgi:spore coat polysaccharide biosynthesis protein SpsF